MPPQSRGTLQKPPSVPNALYTRSTPNLPTLKSLRAATGTDSSAATTSALYPTKTTPDGSDTSSKPASISNLPLPRPPGKAARDDTGSEDSDSSEEASSVPNLPTRPIFHHHSRSHTYLAPSTFAPPFYGRPPTPLPPSPSLTSLLRPTFSTANSRPTTPDHSSDEAAHHAAGTTTPNSTVPSHAPTNGALSSSYLRPSKPLPRASPKVPTYEYYGFTLYLTSSLVFIGYVLWSFLPSPFLHQFGIYYYPNRWWALAIPAWTVMLVVYIYVALASYNIGYLTVGVGRMEALVDEAAAIAGFGYAGAEQEGDGGKGGDKKQRGRGGKKKAQQSGSVEYKEGEMPDWDNLWTEGTDAVMDIPIGGVCEILYGDHHDDERDGEVQQHGQNGRAS